MTILFFLCTPIFMSQHKETSFPPMFRLQRLHFHKNPPRLVTVLPPSRLFRRFHMDRFHRFYKMPRYKKKLKIPEPENQARDKEETELQDGKRKKKEKKKRIIRQHPTLKGSLKQNKRHPAFGKSFFFLGPSPNVCAPSGLSRGNGIGKYRGRRRIDI